MHACILLTAMHARDHGLGRLMGTSARVYVCANPLDRTRRTCVRSTTQLASRPATIANGSS
jgi:hypothetical protein